MDWTLAIVRNRDALKPIIAALCALAGLTLPHRGDVSREKPVAEKGELPSVVYPAVLPRHVIAAILLVLRPAESAVRRLIVILAALSESARRTSVLPLIRSFGPPSPRKQRGEGETHDVLQDDHEVSKELNDVENTSKSMRLSPSPRVFSGAEGGRDPWLAPFRWREATDEGQRQFPVIIITSKNTSSPSKTPDFALFDPLKSFDPDAIWNLEEANESGFHSGEDSTNDPAFGWRNLPDANQPFPAHSILRRLAAIRRALETLPYQARRLLRRNARRDAQPRKPFKGPIRLSPMRPGLPPGWRQRPIHEIDPILKECHLLANDLLCDTG